MPRVRIILFAVFLLAPGVALAQGLKVAFGGMSQEADAPVEVTSDSLSVNEAEGTAEFTGNVLIGQGEMRLSAPKVQVIYDESAGRIARLVATGGVTLVSDQDAAEAREAEYDIDGRTILMRGDVLLTQGNSTMSAARMTVDLDAGTAVMSGRVKTILQGGDN